MARHSKKGKKKKNKNYLMRKHETNLSMKTSTDDNHSHEAMINDSTGSGFTSTDDDHFHSIRNFKIIESAADDANSPHSHSIPGLNPIIKESKGKVLHFNGRILRVN